MGHMSVSCLSLGYTGLTAGRHPQLRHSPCCASCWPDPLNFILGSTFAGPKLTCLGLAHLGSFGSSFPFFCVIETGKLSHGRGHATPGSRPSLPHAVGWPM
jgi:hypothetical protein